MTNQDIQNLNGKLAKWLYPPPEFRVEAIDLGINKHFGHITIELMYSQKAKDYINGQQPGLGEVKKVGEWYRWETLPIFTDSLDACFKWLVPKLGMYELNSYNQDSFHFAWVSLLEDGGWFTADSKDPALALCRAIEKLIGDEND